MTSWGDRYAIPQVNLRGFFHAYAIRIALFSAIIVFMLILGTVLSLYLKKLTYYETVSSAEDTARVLSRQIAEMRLYYTANTVVLALNKGLKVTHDYREIPNAIPLPATMVHDLSEAISTNERVKVRLFSAYPFPFRQNGGPHDDFESQALSFLSQNPGKVYSGVGQYQGILSYRYATADVMKEQSCVNCHNSHPLSPKKDWKLGDVRGVLEVAVPIEEDLANSELGARNVVMLVGVGLLLILVVTGVILQRRVFGPIDRMARGMPAGYLEQTLIHRSRDELGKLVRSLHQVYEYLATMSELESENRRIQEASRLKSEFVANMSHELRTPLNSIVGFSELLSDGGCGSLNEEQAEYLGYIGQSANHLLCLINDVLDLAKVESGKLEFMPEVVDLTDLVTQVVDVLRAQALQRHIRLHVEVAELGTVTIDPVRFKQILFNFLSNAVKFNRDGGNIWVRVRNSGPDRFRLEVQDTGVGISREDTGKLFVEFQQLDASMAKRFGGTGLGLGLTRRIVELQGGIVGVSSDPGVGSTFFAELPKTPVNGVSPSEAEDRRALVTNESAAERT